MTEVGPDQISVAVDADIERRRNIERDLWRTSMTESPRANSVENVINKAQDAAILLDLLHRFRSDFERSGSALELGGGQGWASCLVKRLFPHIHATVTDLSPDAVASVGKWERIFEAQVDAAKACTSDRLPEADESVDLIFCFAAAHHFVTHRRTLREIDRVLRPGGRALYLHEPACPDYLYRAALGRVNRKRPEVPEDVLRYQELQRLAAHTGLSCEVQFYPNPAHRGPRETLYYELIGRSNILQHLLPCTANFVFTKA